MSNRFIRDLTINNSDERTARRIKGLETGQEVVPFRPSAVTYIGTETGSGTSTAAINNIGKPTVTTTGLYYISYNMDINATVGFAESFIMSKSTPLTQSVTTGIRAPHVGVWAGLLTAGDQIWPGFLCTTAGGAIAFFTSFVVMRLG